MFRNIPNRYLIFAAIFLVVVALGLGSWFILQPTPTPPITSQTGATYPCNNQQMTSAQIATFRKITVAQLTLLDTQRGLKPDEVCNLTEARLTRALYRVDNPPPDGPEEYGEWWAERQKDEKGAIPFDGYAKASAQIQRMPKISAAPGKNVAGVSPTSWQWLGPGNIGGRVRALVIHPTQPNTMFAGAAAGGVWKTTDGGASWQPLNDFLSNLAVSSLALDPTNPNTLYAGTGEGFFNSDARRGAGIFKSTDGGANWNLLASTSTTATLDFVFVNRIVICPTNSQFVLAATGGTTTVPGGQGVFRSLDGGASWSKAVVSGTTTPMNRMLDIDFKPGDCTKAVAGGSFGDVYYTTDSGVNWAKSAESQAGTFGSGNTSRIELAYAPTDPNLILASVNVNSGEIWKSTNGGANFTRVSTGFNYLGSQGWYDNIIWIDPTNANNVIVGGIDLWRSTNGGQNLTKISQWQSAPNSAHADNHNIVAHPGFNGTSNKTVFFTNDGGIYKANDVYTVAPTTGWVSLNNNLGITQFYGASGNSSGVVAGGTQDNGSLVYKGNAQGWTAMYGGDGGWAASDPTDPNYHYGEYVYLQIHRSSNGGTSSSDIYFGIADATDSNRALFISPFILDPGNSNRMLAGGLELWRSNSVKTTPNWTSIKPVSAVGSACRGAGTGRCISAIAVAPNTSDVIWVGHQSGAVYKTTNGLAATPTWTELDNNGGLNPLPNRVITRIVVSPDDANVVYITLGGFSGDNIWRTTNGGTSWVDITGTGASGLPDVPVYALAVHPGQTNWLYVGTDVGIFASDDGGANWKTNPNDGPSNAPVDDLQWIGGTTKLLAATHGRGVYQANILPPCPNPLTVSILIDNGACGTLRYALTQAQSSDTITVTLAAGSVIDLQTGSSLTVPQGVSIVVQNRDCGVGGPDITLNGANLAAPGLILKGSNLLQNLSFVGVMVTNQGQANDLRCFKVVQP